MSEYIGDKVSNWEKVVYIISGVLVVSALIAAPFMAADSAKRREQLWQTQGCRMYDNYDLEDVPAKCQTYFVDHYNAQTGRNQPPVSQ